MASLNDLLYEFLVKITSATEGATEDLAITALLSALDPSFTILEKNQDIITTSVSTIDWSLGHVCINYEGNTNLTGGFTNIPTDGSNWLTIEFRHNGGLRTLSLLASQLDPSATMPTLAGTSGGVDRLSLRPSLLNPGKYFIKLVESK